MLKSFFQFLFRSFVAAFTSVLVWTISYLVFLQTFLISLLLGLSGGVFIFFVLKWFFSYRFLRNNGLSRKEYNYIKKNLKEAKLKINRLQKDSVSLVEAHPDLLVQVLTLIHLIYRQFPLHPYSEHDQAWNEKNLIVLIVLVYHKG